MKKSFKYSSILFSIASLAFFILIILYVFVYKPSNGTLEEKLLHMNTNWALISSIWRLEFIAAVLIAWVALNFSAKNKWWNLVAIGHILMLVEYILMLGGYPNGQIGENTVLINQMAVLVFAASNFIWLMGMAGVYKAENGWIKYSGMTLSLFCSTIFLCILFGLTTMSEVIFIGPLANLLYLLNAYYGFKLFRRKNTQKLKN